VKRPVTVTLASLLALAFAPGPAQAASKKISTEAEIEFATYTAFSTAEFLGDVHSRRSKCERGRKVTLIHATNGAVASTRTDRTGDWELTLPLASANEGEHVIKVSRKRIKRGGKVLVCKPAISDEVVLAD
jgi:hypothetical protein